MKKFKINKLVIVIVVILAAVITLSFSKNIIAKISIEKGVGMVTGLRLDMRSLNVGIIRTLIGIKDLKLFNPEEFEDRIMVDMPEIYVDYDLGAIFKGKVHLEEVRLNLKKFVVVKNEKGELNLDSLKVVQAEKEEKIPSEEKKAKAPALRIDVLDLKIDKVIYKDYSKGTPPSVKEFNVNINERYENITNPYALASLIMVKALMNTTIASLADFDLGPLQSEISGTLKEATQITKETAGKAIEAGEEAGQKAKEAAKEATEKTTESIKKIFSF
jgi:uncharacterized protein involved in outer membrane biogenesis